MRVRRTLAALLVAPFALAACGGGSSSVADPPVSSSPTSSAPTTQPPAHESPQHFIRRWADEEKRMENTGKTAKYESLSSGCRACMQLASDIRGFYSHGGFAHWGGWQIISITRKSPSVFDVKVDSRPTRYRESADGQIKHLEGGSATHQLTLRRLGSSWHVTQKAQLAR